MTRFIDGGDDFLGCVGQAIGSNDIGATFGQDLASLFDFGPFESHDERHVEADGLVGLDQRRGDRRAAHDAAEDVDEHGPQIWVTQQNAKGFGHLIDIGAAADIQEVRRFASVQFDQIHRAHRQSGTVDQTADVSVELDVAQARLPRPDFSRFFLGQVPQLGHLGVSEQPVVVEAHLGVQGQQLAGLR